MIGRRWARGLSTGVITIAIGCATAEPPPEIRGTWVTDHRDYGGRALVIGADSVTFRIETDGRATRHPIREIEREGTAIVLRYGSAGDTYALRLRLEAVGTLTFVNQPAIRWRRVDAAPAPGEGAVSRP